LLLGQASGVAPISQDLCHDLVLSTIG
jgi:hypothetical protein